MSNESLSTPRETDEKLAGLYNELAKLDTRVSAAVTDIMRTAGARRSYIGRTLAWDKSFAECKATLDTRRHSDTWPGREADETLTRYHKAAEAHHGKEQEISEVADLYTGWSRFFVVTSSAGHIHSSMHCTTCYESTTYGWLPHLSGKTEAEAVEACGPALCSVCFPSAPVEHQGGKLTQAEAAELAKGKTIADLQASKQAERDAKAAKKAEKARKAYERAQRLMAKVEAFYAANGGYEAVMQLESAYNLTANLQAMVQDVVLDDHREYRERRRYNKNPRAIIAEYEAAGS